MEGRENLSKVFKMGGDLTPFNLTPAPEGSVLDVGAEEAAAIKKMTSRRIAEEKDMVKTLKYFCLDG